MFNDPIVEEVRAARKRHAARFNNNLAAIVADFQRKQELLDRPVVSLPPKKPVEKTS